jgi:hypothetical protein
MAKCGSAYCPAQLISASNITETSEPSASADEIENDYIIAGIYLICSISPALIIAFYSKIFHIQLS